MSKSVLYVVATPIGNKGDISLRALAVFKKADIIVCEDSRQTAFLLQHLNILPSQHPKRQPPKDFIQDMVNRFFVCLKDLLQRQKSPKYLAFQKYHDNPQLLVQQVINLMKTKNINVVLVSTAGTPLVSDPGLSLVKAAQESNFEVKAIPGASALTTALMLAGFNANYFVFLGMLPKRTAQRQKWLRQWAQTTINQVTYAAFISKYQLIPALHDIQAVFGNIEIFIGNDLTKYNEQGYKGLVVDLINFFDQQNIKGEFVLVFSSPKPKSNRPPKTSPKPPLPKTTKPNQPRH
ncbi:MAG: 16S rRNA (cytidine(1402)-2'-O)-methyltransferase [bacterium]|nr:16S rRNA (cytidine(1402)-2'-O)-methyltransferase [bacterium]